MSKPTCYLCAQRPATIRRDGVPMCGVCAPCRTVGCAFHPVYPGASVCKACRAVQGWGDQTDDEPTTPVYFGPFGGAVPR